MNKLIQFSMRNVFALLLFPLFSFGVSSPNVIIIQTDEHNLRTLGCYRDQMSEEQAFIWGKGVKVDTPHIDSLARDGLICTNYFASSPVCTPSRASFVSGLYPQATGSPSNNSPLKDSIITFAEVLKKRGYATAYLGKWHLDGPAKPGWGPVRQFGFEDNRFMFNRGHWKKFEATKAGPRVAARKNDKPTYSLDGADEKSFATDWLIDRSLEILERDKEKPFCLMLSLPDPHGPNSVREPYDSMFDHLTFKQPVTMRKVLAALQNRPGWVSAGSNGVKKLNQTSMADYFGMVKCIDDNIGKILRFLKEHNLSENTIVVFTSDHGDMMCEHCRMNKGLPYKTSAGIPFLLRFPSKVPSGKVIETAYTTIDFFPTLMGLMGIKKGLPPFHGLDASKDFTSKKKKVRNDRVVYIRQSSGGWVAAFDHRFKLVLSASDRPWLFDLEKDPDELINFYDRAEYADEFERLKKELIQQMKKFKEPALVGKKLRFE
jgi:arylsulfatase A-like enzyme|tara:strand:+ start:2401 stop:3864 length:1464 start_codon:yes stop_codon:yes gene_type:complete